MAHDDPSTLRQAQGQDCLHCAIYDAIEAHFRGRGDLHGDEVVLDTSETLGAIARLTAEMLTSQPDPILRGALYDAFGAVIREEVTRILAKGDQPEPFVPS